MAKGLPIQMKSKKPLASPPWEEKAKLKNYVNWYPCLIILGFWRDTLTGCLKIIYEKY
jgi:hypothetical protein